MAQASPTKHSLYRCNYDLSASPVFVRLVQLHNFSSYLCGQKVKLKKPISSLITQMSMVATHELEFAFTTFAKINDDDDDDCSRPTISNAIKSRISLIESLSS